MYQHIKCYTLTIIFLSFSLFIHAQNNKEANSFCAHDLLRSIQQKHDHKLKEREDQIDKAITDFLLNRDKKRTAGKNPGQIYTIPVVVHVIHSGVPVGTDENITDAQVIKGIEHLNEAFRNTANYNPSTGADVEIEFCLAIRDPQGNSTTGINRVVSSFTNVTTNRQDDIALKSNITWDQTSYLNIWLVKEITSPTQGSGVAGYAYLASAHGRPIDGVVNEARWFGSSIDNSKVHIHEVGHYLNLYHTFEGGCPNSNCMTNGDNVCDTPPDASTAAVSCTSTPNTCSTDGDDLSANNPFRFSGDQNDMFNNYMDYGYQQCQDAFTEGQKQRMIATLETARVSLLSSLGCQSPCSNLINLTASVDNSSPFIGQSVIFSVNSKPGVTYTWDFGDGTPTTSGNSVSHSYNSVGNFTVTVTAQNSDPNCNEQQELTINVSCAAKASFTSPSSNATIGTPITFTNTSSNATNYEWFIDGVSTNTTTDFTTTFTAQGSYFVQLVANNGTCYDTSQSVFIRVGACNQTGVANVWNFGSQAAVDFSSGSPIALAGSQMSQSEGVASIADANGNLLFYTNGITVWNANNLVMTNGTGLGGAGSSAQSCIIVPAPSSTTLYYIFTVRDWAQSSDFRYSIVDISTNAGLGSVTTKNVLIQSNINEQVTGVFHQNCQDIWIISHENRGANPNRFIAYLLTPTGLAANAVTSDVGFDYLGGNRYGSLRASHNGRNICTTLGGSSGVTAALFDFDRTTGIVSNQQLLAANSEIQNAYSSEFSPNDNVLYIAAYNGNFIYQYDLSAGSTSSIRTSRQNIANGTSTKAALQMGPDGKIYCTQQSENFLGVIDNPNALGLLSNFIEDAIPLGSGRGNIGLPNFLPGFFGDAISISGPTTPCKNAIVQYDINASGCVNSVTWNYSGGGQIVSQNNTSIVIDFSGVVGSHTLSVQARDQCGVISSTLNINTNNNDAPTIDLGKDTVLCLSTLTLDAGAGYTDYLWQDGSTNQTFTAASAGTFHVKVTNALGCVASDSIVLQNYTSPSVNLGPDTTLCFGEILLLDAGSSFSSYFWQDGSGEQKLLAYQPVAEAGTFTYTLTAFDRCNAMKTGSINITFEQCEIDSCTTTIGNDLEMCFGDSIQLNGSLADEYSWSPVSIVSDPRIQNPYITPTTTPIYIYLTTTDSAGCISTDSLLITLNEKPLLSLLSSSSSSACLGDTAQLEVTSDKPISEWKWIENTSTLSATTIPNPLIFTSSTSNYTVVGMDTDGCIDSLTTTITIHDLPLIQTNRDQVICKGESTTISVVENPNFIQYTWTPSTTLTQPTTSNPTATPSLEKTTYTVEVTDVNNCSSKGSVVITTLDNPIPEVHIQSKQTICEGDSLYVFIDAQNHLGTPVLTWKKIDSLGNETTLASDSMSVLIPDLKKGESIQLIATSDENCVATENKTKNSNILDPEVNKYPNLYVTGDTLVCLGEPLFLSVVDSNNVSTSFTWTNLNTQKSTTTLSTQFISDSLFYKQLYTVSATNVDCESTSPPFEYHFIPLQINLISDRDTIRGSAVTLTVLTNSEKFTWSSFPIESKIPTNTTSTTQTPIETINYVVTGELNTCITSDTIQIVVLNDISAPYLFSPNNDNNNDVWIIDQLINYSKTNVKIYNRWGMKLKELTDGENTWDGTNESGTPVADGTYYYTIVATANGESISFTGYVTIIR